MLLRFIAKNHLSIASEQELSLIASSLNGPESGLIDAPNLSGIKVLPAAIIYGANASGKTNWLKAFQFLRAAVLHSHNKGDPEGGVPRKKFALDDEIGDSPSLVEAEFLIDGVRHQFGFQCDDNEFLGEWLYSYPEGKRRKIYEREHQKVTFGPSFKGPKKTMAELMRNNSLFLSTATQNDHQYLSEIVKFFRKTIVNTSIKTESDLVSRTFKKDQIDQRAINFLKLVGTGVVGYKQKSVQLSEEIIQFKKGFQELVKSQFGESGQVEISESDVDVEISLAHKGKDGNECLFPIESESAGTRRLLLLLNSVFKALDDGTLIFIDEIDASLHTVAAEKILQMFCDKAFNKKGAQIIATTHDTNLLKSDFLRRDQIWFCEKDDVGGSHIFALSDFKLRQTDNFENGYLEGRFGAIPFSGDMDHLMANIETT